MFGSFSVLSQWIFLMRAKPGRCCTGMFEDKDGGRSRSQRLSKGALNKILEEPRHS